MPVTVGDAVKQFLASLSPDLSPSVRCRYHATVAKHIPWQVFRRLPVTAFPSTPPPAALAGKTAGSAAEMLRTWHRLGRFLGRSEVAFLTLGDGIDAFLAALRVRSEAVHPAQQVHSTLRVAAREYIYCLPISALDLPLARSLRHHAWASDRRGQVVRQFLRFLQVEQLVPFQLVGLRPPRQSRPLQRWLAAAPSADTLTPRSPLLACTAYYLRHLQDATNRTDLGIQHVFGQLRTFVTWCTGRGLEAVGDVTRTVVDEFLAYQEKEWRNGPSTLRSRVLTLRSFFSFLVESAVLAESPTSGVLTKPIAFHPPADVLTDDEAGRLVATPRRLLAELQAGATLTVSEQGRRWLLVRDAAILELLLHTGIRAGELRDLTLAQLDLRRGRLRIAGKGDAWHCVKERWVYLESPSVIRALEEYLAVRPATRGAWLFVNSRGNPLSTRELFVRVRRYAREAGITKPLGPHRLRAYFASSLVAGGIDPLALQALMGHHSLRTTLRHYVALDEEHLRAVWRATNPLAHLQLHREEEPNE